MKESKPKAAIEAENININIKINHNINEINKRTKPSYIKSKSSEDIFTIDKIKNEREDNIQNSIDKDNIKIQNDSPNKINDYSSKAKNSK